MTSVSYILSKEQYQQFAAGFATRAHSKTLSSGDMLLNNILRNKDVRRGFTPITNPSKLGHGMDAWQGFIDARRNLNYQIRWSKDQVKHNFGIEITDDMADAILAATKDSK